MAPCSARTRAEKTRNQTPGSLERDFENTRGRTRTSTRRSLVWKKNKVTWPFRFERSYGYGPAAPSNSKKRSPNRPANLTILPATSAKCWPLHILWTDARAERNRDRKREKKRKHRILLPSSKRTQLTINICELSHGIRTEIVAKRSDRPPVGRFHEPIGDFCGKSKPLAQKRKAHKCKPAASRL